MRISVIIPAYNAEESLKLTLDSVLAQSRKADEIIVINDGSQDATEQTAKSYGEKITYLHQENAGQGAARNLGLRHASGELIAFLDADDFWRPQFLQRCEEFLAAHPQAIAVNCGLITRLANGRELRQPASLQSAQAKQQPYMLEDFFAFWAEHDHVRTGSVLIRREAVETVGEQRADLRVSQDLEYWVMLGTVGPWGYIPEALWVGNSREAARGFDWLRKYRKRRKLCPSVEQWQQRVRPKLDEQQFAAFRIVRGRVAAHFAQSHILAGRRQLARAIIREYSVDLPNWWTANLLKSANRFGSLSWHLACALIVIREYQKALCSIKIRSNTN